MYPKYFGLKEPSFSIAPDPHYLFLSEQHKEALAHLLYGAGESGGFVLLTGEVGTGKTTVCRAFLEQLPEGVEVALILNPALTANELLLNICDEFRIPVTEGERSVKPLVDRLNQYLLESHSQGRRPLLIIDEAQNLRPKVMEQIRLLTNLETTKHKLLQIFLIGQPELRRMLEREGLRQINQRITARFHLRPFTLKETSDYIRHRVAVGGVDRPLFTAPAIRRIHRYAGGIPRLINILCDRALLGACVTRGSQVTPAIVDQAAREVRGNQIEVPARPVVRPAFAAAAAFTLALVAGWLSYQWLDGSNPGLIDNLVSNRPAWLIGHPEPAPPPQSQPPTPSPGGPSAAPTSPASTEQTPNETAGLPAEAQPAPQVQPSPTETLPRIALAHFESGAVEETLARVAMPEPEALRLLLRRWGVELNDLGKGDPCAQLVTFGLRCERERGKLSNVRFFDLPSLLRVPNQAGVRRFVVLGALAASDATLDLVTGSELVPVEALERIWTGDYTLVWQPPPTGGAVIGPGSSGEAVRWLRRLLSQIPGSTTPASESGQFDSSLSNSVRDFQASQGLTPDGIAGARTLIRLNQAVAMPGIPRLYQVDSITTTVVGTP